MCERRRVLAWLCAAALGAGPAFAQSDAYPVRSVRLVVPFPPGGFNDQLARILGQKLHEAWGQTVVVENRPGGGSQIGTQAVATATPDGYTLLMASFAFAVNPALYAKLPYDTLRDFAPVILCAATPNLLVVGSEVPVKSLKELVALAKSKPGELAYASAGLGSSNHLSMEMLKTRAGIDLIHVPYKGSAPAVIDVVGGRVQAMFDNVPNVLPQVQSGKLRALAVTSPRRFALMPELPTVAESGIRDFEVSVWFGVVAPARTPQAVIDQINKDINRILLLPEVQSTLKLQGVETVGGSPQQFAVHLRNQMTRWSGVVKEAGIRLE
jgi:tripartite-type tricarboxylate transporter receptor subunit TctC